MNSHNNSNMSNQALSRDQIRQIVAALPFPAVERRVKADVVNAIRYNYSKLLETQGIPSGFTFEQYKNDVIARYRKVLALSQSDDAGRPRKLTEIEIETIISNSLPAEIPTAGDEPVRFSLSGKYIITAYADKIRYQLQRIYLTPKAIPEMIEQIKQNFLRSLAPEGMSIGVYAAGSMGQIITQATLNTFHLSGVKSNVTGGIKAYAEVLEATKNRSNPTSNVYFQNKSLSYFEALDIAHDIAHTSVADLIDTTDIIRLTGSDPYFLSGQPYWYTVYKMAHQRVRRDSDYDVHNVLRLTLKTDLMYLKGIGMPELCKKIEHNTPKSNQPGGVFCIPSPFNMGIIDIYAIRDQITTAEGVNLDDDEREYAFLNTAVYPNLGLITMRGIPGIAALVITEYKMDQNIISQEYIDD